MVTRLDREVGRILELIAELGLEERTIVVFVSDNGPTFDVGGADSAFFRIRSLSGLAFLGERDAALENGTWHGIYAVPGGSLYQVTLVAREGATLRESDPLTVAVP